MEQLRMNELGVTAALGVKVELIAVLTSANDRQPRVMTVQGGRALPSGPFEQGHRSLQSGLRSWVEAQTHHPLGYVEQLYTFADGGRSADYSGRAISISYLGLTREGRAADEYAAAWHNWYEYFPWEDHRDGRPALIDTELAPRLEGWAKQANSAEVLAERWQRIAISFGLGGHEWNEELVLQRYELLFEAALVAEALSAEPASSAAGRSFGRAMTDDHRRILATAIARLRAKIKYRPVVFELMAPQFTLLQLQRTVEALAGQKLHKPNFRRLIEQSELVEETGTTTGAESGRPAKLFRFRHAVLAERAIAGTKLPRSRP
eukprot:gene13347-13461_t